MRSAKEVKKTRSKNFYLCIISSIKSHGKLPVCSDLGISKQALNYYVRKLKIDERIEKLGYGVWRVNERKETIVEQPLEVKICTLGGYTNVQQRTSKKNNIRGHNFQIKLLLKRGIDIIGMTKRRYEGNFINKGGTYRIKIDDRIVWINRNSIIVHFKPSESFLGHSAVDTSKSAIYYFRAIIRRIENDVGRMLWINKEYQIEILRAEYANINNELARDFNQRQDKLQVFDNGKCWLLIDNSFKQDECETVGKNSEINMDGVVMPLFTDLKRQFERQGRPVLFSDLLELQLKTQDQLYSISQVLASQYKPIDDGNNSKLNNYIG